MNLSARSFTFGQNAKIRRVTLSKIHRNHLRKVGNQREIMLKFLKLKFLTSGFLENRRRTGGSKNIC